MDVKSEPTARYYVPQAPRKFKQPTMQKEVRKYVRNLNRAHSTLIPIFLLPAFLKRG